MAKTVTSNEFAPKTIRTSQLKISDVPDSNSNWNEIARFALSFAPIEELGTEDIYTHPKMTMDFDENSSLIDLRTSLFFMQRFWNNRSVEIDEKNIKKAKDLVELIRKNL